MLLTQEPSRSAFELAEESAFALEQSVQRLRASQARYAVAHVDYDQMAREIEDLAASMRHTFRPDLPNGSSIAPLALPVQVDGSFWRIGNAQP